MRTLYIKNKVFSIGAGSYVEDETGINVYQVKGKVFSPTHKKFIYDMSGNRLYIVRNKWWKFFKHSAFIYDGKTKQKLFRIKEKFFSLDYDVLNSTMPIVIQGKFLQGITVYLNGAPIGKVSRNLIDNMFRDSFKLEVFDEEYTGLLVAIVIALDNIQDNRKNQNR